MTRFHWVQRSSYAMTLSGALFFGVAVAYFAVVLPLLAWDEFVRASGGSEKIGFGFLLVIAAVVLAIYGVMMGLGGMAAGLVAPTRITRQWYLVLLAGQAFLCVGGSIGLLFVPDPIRLDWRLQLFVIPFAAGGGLAFISRWVGLLLGWLSMVPTGFGLCDTCGYDLRHVKLGGSCPECGAVRG